MKTSLIILMLFVQTKFVSAQRNTSASKEIKDAIGYEFNKWLAKDQFETSAVYEARIKNKSEEELKILTDNSMKSIKANYLTSLSGTLGTYDAENQTFLITYDQKWAKRDSFLLKVPQSIAATMSVSAIQITLTDIAIVNDKWAPKEALIIFCTRCGMISQHMGSWSGLSLNVTSKNGGFYSYDIDRGREFQIVDLLKFNKSKEAPDGVYYYKWDITQQPNYSPSSAQPISFTLEDLNISLPTISTNTQTAVAAKPIVPDLDMSAIHTTNKNTNAFAVVIGNRDYQSTKKVSYAVNDAQTIKKYLVNVLGYSEGNIFYLENATKSSFETYFGTKENPEGKLYNNIKQNISDVFIYYAGHGAPGLKDNKGYFVPVDCDPQYVEQGGYSLDLFYNNIAKLHAKSITVVTDACFSGAEIFNNISPVLITVSNPIAVAENCIVLSSSSGSQVSSWYNDKQHGMFTYFFLKSLQDNAKSDTNKDGKLTFNEIFKYVSDKTEGVPYYARSIHGVDQTPTIQGTGVDNVFVEYK